MFSKSSSKVLNTPTTENPIIINKKNKPKGSLGFFGYIFLIIIIGFSLVGIIKTFENDLLNNFPETKYIIDLFNEQLEYLAESVKNLIVLISDLTNSY